MMGFCDYGDLPPGSINALNLLVNFSLRTLLYGFHIYRAEFLKHMAYKPN
jgi:hypothetical protein